MPSLSDNLAGREYWRSLEQLAQSPEVMARFEQEFVGYDPQEMTGLSRRSFLRVMGAAMGLAGLTLTGCRRWPEQEIRPHAHQPEGTKPGQAEHYATLVELAGVATGVLVKSFDGRPIKVEGNSLHPFSLGAADAWAQASVLDLYDPDRSRFVLEQVDGQRRQRSWDDWSLWARGHFAAAAGRGGRGLAVLCEQSGSPTLARLRQEFSQAFPEAAWHTWEPIHRDQEIAGTRQAFGRALRPQCHLSKARIIACFDADLLGLHPAHQKHARDWAAGRQTADRGQMNRLYCIEPSFTLTGSVADQRLPARPSRIGPVLAEVAQRLGLAWPRPAGEGATPAEQAWAEQLAADLKAHPGQALVAVGADQPAVWHHLACAINARLGAVGKTLTYIPEPAGDGPGCVESITALAQALAAGQVGTLLILGGNPVYDAPAELKLGERLGQLAAAGGTALHLSLYVNETSLACRWHLPRAHYLECWGDGLAWDGTYSVQQPLILPLFEGKSPAEVLALVIGRAAPGLDLVRETFRRRPGQGDEARDFERSWRRVLHDGLLADSAAPAAEPGAPAAAPPESAPPPIAGERFELTFPPDTCVFDGRFANNGWLQELPDPLTKLTWDNAALMAKADADRLGLTTGDVIRLVGEGGASLEIAAYVMPGQAQGAIALPLGYGRTAAGHVGNGAGFDTYRLRWQRLATVKPAGRRYALALTQDHHLLDGVGVYGRDKRVGAQGQSGYLVREATLQEYRQDKHVFHRNAHGAVSLPLFDPPNKFNDPHAWGMAVDLNTCLGCSACVIACQAENNIPIAGKEQVANTREMHWLRIDRYFKGPVEAPDVVFQPLACVHCENAPCEQVCPVAATVHDAEGLNTMVYNRCIGTRYCANNCPYKVRRFNYFDYHSKDPRGAAKPWLGIPDAQQESVIDQIKRMVYNPDVTVRMRGVMEKCTYCVQRLQAAKIHAKVEQASGRRTSDLVGDGEVVTACQAACPTQAIVFGNLNDPTSRVAQAQRGQRSYVMLEELNVKPRTAHLAKVRNPAG